MNRRAAKTSGEDALDFLLVGCRDDGLLSKLHDGRSLVVWKVHVSWTEECLSETKEERRQARENNVTW